MRVGGDPPREGSQSASLRRRVSELADSHACRTPWSVFQGGSNGSPAAMPWARVLVEPMARAHPRHVGDIMVARSPSLDRPTAESVSQAEQRTGLEPFRIRPEHSVDPHPLPSRQFQVLFDSLFKVLFIFPSRYLFAIGLSPIFSLGRNLPPNWGCVPRHAAWSGPDGALTLPGTPFQGTWARSVAEDTSPDYNSDGFNRQILKLG
ncbi:hypothetical protein ZIOFF_061122 [Zingiber officinale]|uniref:Uncharacterized protein n=1 Tax=Zingiber officinale TaxID=94328 RepID=A0A8J5KCJ0_ZINOF|nr:hypothetical protein ZIOFF_061122 [Zingiber officinale]